MLAKVDSKVRSWSEHPRAIWYLAGVSFAEASFFIIPPDVLLAPITLARPERAAYYALVTTLASVLGGILGYSLGFFLVDFIQPVMQEHGYWHWVTVLQDWLALYGFKILFLLLFVPLPYKIYSIAAGIAELPLWQFVVASLFVRGIRFFVVAYAVRFCGKAMQTNLMKYGQWLGWLALLVIMVGIVIKQSGITI